MRARTLIALCLLAPSMAFAQSIPSAPITIFNPPAISTSSGVTSVAGTANQIDATGTTSVTLSLDPTIVTPGSVSIGGVGGLGFLELQPQSAITATPAANTIRLNSNSVGNLVIRISSGFAAQLNMSALTTSKTFAFQDLGGSIAMTANNLGAFAATTSAQLAGVISDETGTGLLVFGTSPALTTPNIGVAVGTSLSLGGATIGTDALGVTGTTTLQGLTAATISSAAHTITSASATAFSVGLNGSTNSAFNVNASTALQVAGLSIVGAVTGGTVAEVVTDSGANANLTINAKGTGTIGIGSVSTGAVTITPALTLSNALTYGGVTLANSVTGTASMVLSTSPTITSPTFATNATTSLLRGGITTSSTLTLESTSAAGTTDSLSLKTGSQVTAIGIDTSQLITLPRISTDATHTDSSICQDSTTHALYFGSGTLGVCLGTSSMRFKVLYGPEHPIDIAASLPGVMQIHLINYRYKLGFGDNGKRRQNGLFAEDLAKVFPECVVNDKGGKPVSVDGFCLYFRSLKAQQEMQGEISDLQKRVASLASAHTNY